MGFFKASVQKVLGTPTQPQIFAMGTGGIQFEVISPTDRRMAKKVYSFMLARKRVKYSTGSTYLSDDEAYLAMTANAIYFLEYWRDDSNPETKTRISIPMIDHSISRPVQSWRVKAYKEMLINGDRWSCEALSTPAEAGTTLRDLNDIMVSKAVARYAQLLSNISKEEVCGRNGGNRLGIENERCKLDTKISSSSKATESEGQSYMLPFEYDPDILLKGSSCSVSFEALPEYREIDEELSAHKRMDSL
ncbi:hypothetical protein TWF730_010095 [Orbilia blumenaviensis]|uniref:Uncharacterized protein n=1 Tax=Orbilia blumenaviensis TaxID=1796055 RepID=A0AAV9UTU1_9PEZI